MDGRFKSSKEIVNRLLQKYRKQHNLIVAYDFDDTVFPSLSGKDTCISILRLIKRSQNLGFTTILFTCRGGDRLKWAITYLDCLRINPTYINENPLYPLNGSYKPRYDILLDDKAGLGQTCECLDTILSIIEKERT